MACGPTTTRAGTRCASLQTQLHLVIESASWLLKCSLLYVLGSTCAAYTCPAGMDLMPAKHSCHAMHEQVLCFAGELRRRRPPQLPVSGYRWHQRPAEGCVAVIQRHADGIVLLNSGQLGLIQHHFSLCMPYTQMPTLLFAATIRSIKDLLKCAQGALGTVACACGARGCMSCLAGQGNATADSAVQAATTSSGINDLNELEYFNTVLELNNEYRIDVRQVTACALCMSHFVHCKHAAAMAVPGA